MEIHDEVVHQLISDMGYVRGKVEGMEKHLATQNGSVADLVKRVGAHDVILGKLGVIITGTTFVLTLVFGMVKDWFSNKFLS